MREDMTFSDSGLGGQGANLGDQGAKDIQHVQERPDGSSDGIPEALDIELPNGFKGCSNWEPGLTVEGPLEDLFKEAAELSPDEEVELFYKIRAICEKKNAEKPKDEQLTSRELDEEAYRKMQEFLKEKKG